MKSTFSTLWQLQLQLNLSYSYVVSPLFNTPNFLGQFAFIFIDVQMPDELVDTFWVLRMTRPFQSLPGAVRIVGMPALVGHPKDCIWVSLSSNPIRTYMCIVGKFFNFFRICLQGFIHALHVVDYYDLSLINFYRSSP